MLMVLMDPPAGLEAEFQDWYDMEHTPERARISGFLSASRWVCLDGWPRFMACYDLETVDVLQQEAYRAISGDNFSPWSRRILPRAFGRERLILEEVTSGLGPLREESRGLALLRFRGHRTDSLRTALDALGLPAVCRLRLFLARGPGSEESAVVIEAPAAALIPSWRAEQLAGCLESHAPDLLGVWRYTRYVRTSM